MEKDLVIGSLFQYYKSYLTEKQADAIDLYYNQDLSLGEIAQELKISRQAVLDHISRAKARLCDLESKFSLAEKTESDAKKLTKIKNLLIYLTEENCKENIECAISMLNDMIENRM